MACKNLDNYLPEIIGKRYGKTVVINHLGSNKHGKRIWSMQCDCGVKHVSTTGDLSSGRVTSCGCASKDRISKLKYKHGHAKASGNSVEYQTYNHMLGRCFNQNKPDYRHYGGRGITVCDRWRESFENFLADMGSRPAGMSLDRIDVNGNYEPGNCRWIPVAEQQSNKRNNRVVTVNGETGPLKAMCDKYSKHKYDTVRARLNKGLSVEEAFFKESRYGR